MNTYTLTKRRNLLITSLLLFLISYSGIELGHNLSITSMKFTIQNTTVIYIMLWSIYAYFLIRFSHCLLDMENKDADEARELLTFFNPPLHELKSYERFDGYLGKIWRFFTFFATYMLQLVVFMGRSIFGKSFFEYLFPIIFAILVGVASYYSPFMESKKEAANKLVNSFWCSAKNKSYNLLLPDYLKRFETFKVNCTNENDGIGIAE